MILYVVDYIDENTNSSLDNEEFKVSDSDNLHDALWLWNNA